MTSFISYDNAGGTTQHPNTIASFLDPGRKESILVNLPTISNHNQIKQPLLQVFPNPASHQVNVDFVNIQPQFLQVKNALGQTVFEQNDPSPPLEINVAHLPVGVYYLVLREEQGSIAKKIVVY